MRLDPGKCHTSLRGNESQGQEDIKLILFKKDVIITSSFSEGRVTKTVHNETYKQALWWRVVTIPPFTITVPLQVIRFFTAGAEGCVFSFCINSSHFTKYIFTIENPSVIICAC